MNKAIIFSYITFLSTIDLVSIVFKISSSHANTNLPKRRFLNEQFSMSKYSLILNALSHSQWNVLGFHR